MKKDAFEPFAQNFSLHYHHLDPNDNFDIDEIEFSQRVGQVIDELRQYERGGTKVFAEVSDNGHSIDLMLAHEAPLRDIKMWTNVAREMFHESVAKAG